MPKRTLERDELKQFLGMLMLDEALRLKFMEDPNRVAAEEGLKLTRWETKFLSKVLTAGELPVFGDLAGLLKG